MSAVTEYCQELIGKIRVCGKPLEIESEIEVLDEVLVTYKCGHSKFKPKAVKASERYIVATDECTPYEFQIEAVEFGVRANFHFIDADEMGLGKTIVGTQVLALYPKQTLPALLICKAAARTQMLREIARWSGARIMAQVLSGKTEPSDLFKVHIISYNYLTNESYTDEDTGRKSSRSLDRLLKYGKYRTIILDECHLIKNMDSQRTQAVKTLVKEIKKKHSTKVVTFQGAEVSREDSALPNIIGLSGTPIKNRPTEYYPILNMIDPARFINSVHFTNNYCLRDWTGKVYGVNGHFHNVTKDIVIRRLRKDVMSQLPTVTRSYFYAEMGMDVKKAYNETLKEFQDYYNDPENSKHSMEFYSNSLAYISRMRHLTGIAKTKLAIDKAEEFVSDVENGSKLLIFTHHIDVAWLVKEGIDPQLEELGWSPALAFKGGMSQNYVDEVVETFQKDSKCKIMIASTLAGGESLNLQFCADAIFVERQWNPANEEQAEGRMIRIGQLANKVNAMYLVATGTIDEYFCQLVERKRSMFKQVMDRADFKWSETELMRELFDLVGRRGSESPFV